MVKTSKYLSKKTTTPNNKTKKIRYKLKGN